VLELLLKLLLGLLASRIYNLFLKKLRFSKSVFLGIDFEEK
jgi:hypothetical protein